MPRYDLYRPRTGVLAVHQRGRGTGSGEVPDWANRSRRHAVSAAGELSQYLGGPLGGFGPDRDAPQPGACAQLYYQIFGPAALWQGRSRRRAAAIPGDTGPAAGCAGAALLPQRAAADPQRDRP